MEDIFNNIETEKRIEINDRLWQRVEDKLDVKKYKFRSKIYKLLAIAAVFLVLIAAIVKFPVEEKRLDYRVTDISIQDTPAANTSTETTFLQELYRKVVDCQIKGDKLSC